MPRLAALPGLAPRPGQLGAPDLLHPTGQRERAPDRLAGPAHALRVAAGDRDDADVVQHALGAHRGRPDPVGRQGQVTRRGLVQAVAGQDHLEVLRLRVPTIGQGRVGRRADHVADPGQLQHVGHMTAAAALDVERVDHPAVQHRQGVGHHHRLVQPVGVQCDLHVVLLGDGERGVQCARMSAGVLVHLQPAGAALDQRLDDRLGPGRGSPGQEAEVDRIGVERGESVPQRPRRAHPDPPDRTELLRQHGGHAGREAGGEHPGRQQVHVGVDRARGGDQTLTADHRGSGADDHVDVGLQVRVTGPTDRRDPALPDADARLPYAQQRIEDQHVRDHQVAGLLDRDGAQQQAVPGGLAETHQELVAAMLGVVLDLDDQAGVAEMYPVAGGRAVDRRVVGPVEVHAAAVHAPRYPFWRASCSARSRLPAASREPSTSPAKPITTRSPP